AIVADDLLAQRKHARRDFLCVGFRIFLLQLCSYRRQIGLRLFPGDAGLQPGEGAEEVRVPVGSAAVNVHLQGHHDLGIKPRKNKLAWQNTNYSEGVTVERDGLSYQGWVRSEPALPESMSQHNDSRACRTVVVGDQGAAQCGVGAQHLECVCRHSHSLHSLRVAGPGQVRSPVSYPADLVESLVSIAKINKVGD